MKKYFIRSILFSALFLLFGFDLCAQNRTFFQKIAGHWEGILEYQDYTDNRRVKLKTYLTVTPSGDGLSAEFATVYDDFGRIIKDRETDKIDLSANKYFSGEHEYSIESTMDEKIVLTGKGQDGETVEPIRLTITFSADTLNLLKETRTPWQFRNQLTFKRATQNVLSKRTLSPTQLKEDFSVLKKALVPLHPGIMRYQTPESLEKIFSGLELKLTKPLSESDFFKLVSELTSQIYCGHTYANPYNQNSLVRERLFNNKTYLPFYFRIIEGKFIVTENASAQNLPEGSEIRKINGIPVSEIIKTLWSISKADGKNTLAHRINNLELARFEAERYAAFDLYFPLFFPLNGETYTIEAVDFAAKKTITFQTAAMTKAERTAEMEKRYGIQTYDDGWKFEIQQRGIAYLKIANSITWRLKKVKFKEFLENAFSEIRAKSIKSLIIDLRGNGGGDTDIGFELSRYLAKKKLPAYIESKRLIRNTVAAQTDLLKYIDTYDEKLKETLKNGLPQNMFKKGYEGYFEFIPDETYKTYPPVLPYENNFAGKAFIISDASNASAAFQFLNYVQQNRLAVIAGQETGGNKQGINGGNYLFLSLPNSKIEIDIPVFYIAPLAEQKDESIIPDIKIKQNPKDVGKGVDTELEYVRKLIMAMKP